MGFDDFRRCYPEEFEAICRAWAEMREGDSRADWERTRISASICISPHVRRPIPPAKLMPMPWDKSPAEAGEKLSKEERKARAAAIMAEAGIK